MGTCLGSKHGGPVGGRESCLSGTPEIVQAEADGNRLPRKGKDLTPSEYCPGSKRSRLQPH
jgi:hypothetical protein